jgi:coenzyme F420-reducing hydrogenase beta subunit
MAQKSYKVESFRIGLKGQGDQIIFASMEDMEQAYKDIDNGKDIYIEKDGVVTKLLQQMLTSKIYDGSIVLGARVSPSAEVKEGE